MKKYDPQKIEKKWQKIWDKTGVYKNYGKKKKFYALDMFPYPSGAGLHVGHPKGYIATDAISRFKMLQGYGVLHPMGWDAFGLPAENYAIKNKIHPKIAVKKNIAVFKKQLEMFGFTYDWDKEINTTDPDYYKWTQWIFLKMFEKGLAYESEEPVNWCPSCKTVLANEDLEKGFCERCGSQVTQKKMRQWVLKMTAYADRLLYDLDAENLDWEELIKEQQRNWIGRSEGAQFEMKIKDCAEKIEVYTTRLDTVFGMTYAVVAPEHKIIAKLKSKIKNYGEVEKYIIQAQSKTELERTELQKEKTGVELKGIKTINPFNGEEIPLFAADYVLGFYGTGAVMAVPAHDERDFEFAKKHGLSIKQVICEFYPEPKCPILNKAYVKDGKLVDSGEFTGLESAEARKKMTEWLKKKSVGEKKVNYKMRDWVFSRQRYWGEPFPLVFCENCAVKIKNQSANWRTKIKIKEFSKGELLNPGWIAVPEKDLPVKLPEVKSYEPTGTGESPLANIKEWVNAKCPKCGGAARRETNTMPQWAGSSWYYLRYIDPKNNKALVDKRKEKKWMPVDLYVGGAEHATRHLLYARFWHKFLYDIKAASAKEPFKKLVHVGLILAEDGRKMSKRWNNVINPNDVINEFGADAMRLYEMFMGPFTQNISWSAKGVVGMKRFLERIWALSQNLNYGGEYKNNGLERLLHKTIKKVTEDIENFKFNTAISALMILTNEMEKEKKISKNLCSPFLILLSPFTPHIAEEIWENFGNKKSIFSESWPKYDPKMIKEEKMGIVVQINGKVRDKMEMESDAAEEEIKASALSSEKIKGWTRGKEIKKIVFVPGKLINIVI